MLSLLCVLVTAAVMFLLSSAAAAWRSFLRHHFLWRIERPRPGRIDYEVRLALTVCECSTVYDDHAPFPYKLGEPVVRIDSLPMTGTYGKLIKKALIEELVSKGHSYPPTITYRGYNYALSWLYQGYAVVSQRVSYEVYTGAADVRVVDHLMGTTEDIKITYKIAR